MIPSPGNNIVRNIPEEDMDVHFTITQLHSIQGPKSAWHTLKTCD